MMRRHFITGEWEEVPDDLSGRYAVRDGGVVRISGAPRERSSRSAICSKNPQVSRSMGVHRLDVPAAREVVKKAGYRFDFNERGHVVYTSPAGKKDAMKWRSETTGEKVVNYDGGYGDVCP